MNILRPVFLLQVFFLFSLEGFSQSLTVIQQPFNPYKTRVIDAFNITTVNPATKSANVYLIGRIELQGKGLVAEVKSRIIVITSGSNKLNPDDLDIEYLNYSDQSMRQFEEETGSLPPGNYRICISVGCATPDCDGLGASFVFKEVPLCKDMSILLPSPLLLNFPKDDAEIELTRPQLTWIPPMPIASQQTLTYTLRLVEKMENQSALDAVTRNRPVLEQTGIEQIFLNYPPDLDELDTSKKYAWRVEAYSGDLKIATSEAWYFKFRKKEKKVLGIQYFIPKSELGLESFRHNKKDTLAFVIRETYYSKDKKWDIQVEEETGNFKKSKIPSEVFISQGRINLIIYPESQKRLTSGIPLLFSIKGNDSQAVIIRLYLY